MHQPLIILSPPRSFSSVVSTMIGQHPQMYGFPELYLFSFDTVGEIANAVKGKGEKPSFPGIIRTIAQEQYGVQTTENNIKAVEWLRERSHWSTEKLFNYLLDLVSPKIGVEKTPATVKKTRWLERAYAIFPQAYFLHLTRHPVSSAKSVEEFVTNKAKNKKRVSMLQSSLDGLLTWFYLHRNILSFTQTLPVGQTMRIKGENLLSQPDVYLPQIAQWLGLRTDTEAIEAMKHPENSPYAYVGSFPARGGNDVKFMRNPQLRSAPVKEDSLQTFWSENLSPQGKEFDADLEVAQKITILAHSLGYQ